MPTDTDGVRITVEKADFVLSTWLVAVMVTTWFGMSKEAGAV